MSNILLKINHKSNLTELFNFTLERMHFGKVSTSPKYRSLAYYNSLDESKRSDLCAIYYESLMIEQYFSDAVEALLYMKNTAIEYIEKYNCSWEYYARSVRQRYLEAGNGDDMDYVSNREFIKEPTKNDLKVFSFVHDITHHEKVKIINETPPEALNLAYITLLSGTDLETEELLKRNGIICNNTEVFSPEKILEKAKVNAIMDGFADDLYSAIDVIYCLIPELDGLKWDKDEKEKWERFPALIDSIFNLDIPKLKYPRKEVTNE